MQGILSGLLFIVVFGSILFVAYVTTKLIAQKSGKSMRGKHINIVETISLGFDKQIHLVKAGEDFILIATSGKNVQFLTTLKSNEELENLQLEEKNDLDFKSIIEKYTQNFKLLKKSQSQENKKEGEVSNGVFRNNLNKLKDITFTKDRK